MSLKQQAVAGMFWTSIQTFGGQVINFAVSIVLARLLLPSEFGLIGMISLFMGIGGTLIGAGLTTSLIRTSNPDNLDYSTVFVFNIIVSIILYISMYFAAPFIARFFDQPKLVLITRIYSLSFIVGTLGAVQSTRFIKDLNFKAGTTASIVSTAFSAFVGVTLAFLGFGVMSLVWMGLVGGTVNSVMLWIQSEWKPTLQFDIKKFKKHFVFGSRMMASGLIDVAFTNIYTLLIGKFFSASQLGFYTRANSLKSLPVITFSSILNKVTFPLFAAIKDDDTRLKIVYSKMMKMVIFIIAPILVLMGVLAEPIFRFLFTERWLPAVPYFQILCLNGILLPLHSYNLNILKVKGRSDLFLRLEIVKKVLLIIIVSVSFRYGIYGLLWGQVIYSILAYIINTYYSGKFLKYGVWEQFKDILPSLILASSMGFFVFQIDLSLSKNNDLVRLIIPGSSGVIFFLTFAKIFKFESGKTAYDIFYNKLKFPLNIKRR